MQEQDETLAEIIRQMREERGRTKGFDDTRFRERVELLGPQISLEILRDSITTACVEVLGDNWEERFGQLEEFREKQGHCNVPDRFPENPSLGNWVRWQRFNRRKLTPEHIAKLDQIGFDWNPFDTAWAEKYSELEQYKAIQGNCNVPQLFPDNKALATWVADQRYERNAGRLKPERIKQLEEIGFIWDPLTESRDAMFASLREYKQEFGDCNVPVLYSKEPRLYRWLVTQRVFRKQGRLSKERINQLNELGFVWDQADSAWEAMFSALNEYGKRFGDCKVPQNWSENPELARWVVNIRSRRGKLTADQVARLEAIGFQWKPFDIAWDAMFAALLHFCETNGHCNVPAEYPEQQKLATWVTGQRANQSRLTKERLDRLDSLGFTWDPLEKVWEELFTKLIEYKRVHGDCNVPRYHETDPTLSAWVHTQRQKRDKVSKERIQRLEAIGFSFTPYQTSWEKMFTQLANYKIAHETCEAPPSAHPQLATWASRQRSKREELTSEQIRRLEEIGFDWEPIQQAWDQMFSLLCDYKALHGTCNVPQQWSQNPKLAHWGHNQRQFKRKGKLNEERTRRLESLGFVFDPLTSSWEKMFAVLLDYKRLHGDCNVAENDPHNPRLGQWVRNQRTSKKNGALSEDQIRRIDELGFQWEPKKSAWGNMFAALVEFRVQHGHCNVAPDSPQHQKLRFWCNNQRQLKRRNKLSEDRMRRLEEIGFQWRIKNV